MSPAQSSLFREEQNGPAFDPRYRGEMEMAARFGVRQRRLEGVVPSGSITVDAAMGTGGLPRGRMIELFGPPATGKTTLGLQAIAAVQREGDTAALVDAECAFDPAYAARMGVDTESLLLARSSDGEEAFRILEKLAASKAVDLILVDSVAALLPAEEREAAIGAANPFAQCEMLASGLRRLARALAASPACVLFLNQLRAYHGFGYEETSAGGWSMKLHAAVRADIRETRPYRAGKRLRMKVVKNQLAAPRQLDFDFAPGIGVVPETELLDRGLENGVIRQEPQGYAFNGQVIGRTDAEAANTLETNEVVVSELNTAVRASLGLPQRKPAGRAVSANKMAQRAANE